MLAQTPPPAGQTPPSRTVTLPPVAGQPAAAKPPTVTLSAENPPPVPAAVPPDTVILTIGDKKITAAQFDHMIEVIPNERMKTQARTTGRRQFGDNVVLIEALAQEARKRKLEDTQAFKDESAFQADNLLAQIVYKELLNDKVSEAEAKAYYDSHKGEYEQCKARHILIRFKGSPVPARAGQKELTEEEALAKAQDIRKKLEAGGDFAALAKAESDDAGSGANGGDLGNFGRGRMVPPFEQAAFSLEIGKLSEPVKSQFGYHIIQVQERETKPFAEVRPEIDKKLQQETAQKKMEDLKKASNVVMNPDYFGPPPAPPAPPAEAKPGDKPAAKPATPPSK